MAICCSSIGFFGHVCSVTNTLGNTRKLLSMNMRLFRIQEELSSFAAVHYYQPLIKWNLQRILLQRFVMEMSSQSID